MERQQIAVLAITIFVIIVVCFMNIEERMSDLTKVTSRVDGRQYLVRNLPDKQNACDMLARIRGKLLNACRVLKQKNPYDSRVDRMYERFKQTELSESDSNEKNTSYSINKGEKIVLCLRQKDGTNQFADENIVLFVALHEISHIMTTSIGHTDEFWNNFKFVLIDVQNAGIYKCQDFESKPQKYCGITITNSPAPCIR